MRMMIFFSEKIKIGYLHSLERLHFFVRVSIQALCNRLFGLFVLFSQFSPLNLQLFFHNLEEFTLIKIMFFANTFSPARI